MGIRCGNDAKLRPENKALPNAGRAKDSARGSLVFYYRWLAPVLSRALGVVRPRNGFKPFGLSE